MTAAPDITERNNLALKLAGSFWRLLVSPSTFVAISLLWCLDLGVGSVTAYFNDPQFSAKMDAYPFKIWLQDIAPHNSQSTWVYILTGLTFLMVLSLFLCSINWFLKRRKKVRAMGEFLVHLGFLLVFSGFVVGAIWGSRQQGVGIPVNNETYQPEINAVLRLDHLKTLRGRSGHVLDTVSRMTLIDRHGKTTHGVVRLNHPLIQGAIVIYPRGSFKQISSAQLSGPFGRKLLRPGDRLSLNGNKEIILQKILQEGERSGFSLGPGIILLAVDQSLPHGRQISRHYLTPLSEQWCTATIFGRSITLTNFGYTEVGNYDIHKDPGIWLVLAGGLILGIGIVWALVRYFI